MKYLDRTASRASELREAIVKASKEVDIDQLSTMKLFATLSPVDYGWSSGRSIMNSTDVAYPL